MILVIGGSGSGKSAYAEKMAMEKRGEQNLFYLATMQVFDAEGEKKVARHRKMREGKGFFTIEQEKNIAEAVSKIEKIQSMPGSGQGQRELKDEEQKEKRPAALLECMSNLVANEMFGVGDTPKTALAVAEKVTAEIKVLKEYLQELIVVTNNVFEDGIGYDASTMEYLKALGAVNANLAAMADAVVEVVVGIPVFVKEPLPAGGLPRKKDLAGSGGYV